MVDEATTKTGARLLAETLAANGVEHVFAGPGDIPSAILEALRESGVRVVAARHDAGAALMAEATGRLTGRPGVCLVGGAAGAVGALPGLRLAEADASPMILLVGGIDPAGCGLDAFGTAGDRRGRGALAARIAEIEDAGRVVETVDRAVATAGGGRPGPVVLILPGDAMTATAPAPAAIRPATIVETHPGAAAMWELQKRLWAAKRPLAVVGGSRWSETAVRRFARFADKFDLPIACSFRRQALFDHDDPTFVGVFGPDADPALVERAGAADLILLVGGRFEQTPGPGEGPLRLPRAGQSLVHVHVDVGELGRLHRPDLALHASPAAFAAAAEALEPPPAGVAWSEWRAAARADREAWANAGAPTAAADPADAAPRRLAEALPAEAIVAGGADAPTRRLFRFRVFRRFAGQLAPIAAVTGYGLPAGIAAALARPDRPVVAVAGAREFEATGQEFATAVREGAPVIAVVFDESGREPPAGGRGVAGPDFAAIARAHGGFGATVERVEELGPALDAALARGGPALLHVRT